MDQLNRCGINYYCLKSYLIDDKEQQDNKTRQSISNTKKHLINELKNILI